MGKVKKAEIIPQDLVVVGSSAGGIEALSILIHSLPANFPAPIVLAQHLDPRHPSILDAILRRQTALPVELITSHSELKSGTIYVVPANNQVNIKNSSVEVHNHTSHSRPRPSVDTLFTTAANAFGDRLIAVVLTGSGSDGAIGAIDVKNAGGTIIVQDPYTAHDPSMPLALPPTIVDFEIPIDKIGPLIADLLTRMHMTSSEERADILLQEILEIVSRQASLDFHAYKTSTILRRIGRRMTVTQRHTMREYADYLHEAPEEIGELVKAFLINVTQFFRDTEAFTFLRQEILPPIIARAREKDRVLRFWSAGCATGEEPYSLAMLLTDILGSEIPEWSIKIFATDLDEAAINFARRGLYSESMLKGMPRDYINRFFERVDLNYRISKSLRQMVIFGQQDLSKSAPFPRINLVLCRNVLIYFTPHLQEYVLSQFAFSLSPDGYLFLGKAETVRPVQSNYTLVNKQWKVYRCVGSALPSVRYQAIPNLHAPHLERRPNTMNRPSGINGKQHTDQDITIPSLEIGQLRHYNELLLRFLPMGVVVINRSYHILTANGAARRLLGLRDIATEQDFLHSVRGIPYQDTRAAIDQVFRERTSVTLAEVELDINAGGNGRFVSISIALMQVDSIAPDLAILSITDVTDQVQVHHQLEAVQAEQSQLMNELASTNKHLSDVNKELMDANEELQVANEELVLTHEELQASIEEFETTNEELQATNEELETNNEELQATNEELETTNDELRARTTELQELTSILEGERVRLTEMVELAPYYILVLRSPALNVEAFNPHYARIIEGSTVQGRPLSEVTDLFWTDELSRQEIARMAHEVYLRDTEHTLPRMLTHIPSQTNSEATPTESFFTYTLIPSHNASGHVDGVIIYAIDETAQRNREMQEELDRLKTIFDNTSATLLALFDAQTTELLVASPHYLEVVSQHPSPQNLVGRPWREITMIRSDEHAIQVWNQVLEQRTLQRIPEISYVSSSREDATIWDYTLTPIMNPEKPDTVRFVLASAFEITEQVLARKELERADKMKDTFLALATHELRTPITSIMANTQLLRRNFLHLQPLTQLPSSQQLLTTLDRVILQLNRANRLIGEIADATRIRGSLFRLQYQEQVDLVKLVQSLIEDFSPENREILLRSSNEAITATLDPQRIEQVLTNLIKNAIRYSSPSQPVTISLAQDQQTSNTLLISVQDHGVGIASGDQPFIFDRFFRVQSEEKPQYHNMGLGLYITKAIVEQHGGRIWLDSMPDQGSTFFFTLPITPEVPTSTQAADDPPVETEDQ